jgi:hypothetical protein
MKKWFFEIILYIFSFVFVSTVFQPLKLPEDVGYLILTLVFVGLSMMLSKSLLVFLTVKVVFFTRLFAIFLILFMVFYVLEMFVPGFQIGTMSLQEADLGWLSLKSFEFDKMSVIAVLSFSTALLASLVKLLDES